MRFVRHEQLHIAARQPEQRLCRSSPQRSRTDQPEARVVGAPTSRLDVALQQVQQGDGVAQPIAQAGIVVLLPLNLAAHGVDDLVKQNCAVCLEDLPL